MILRNQEAIIRERPRSQICGLNRTVVVKRSLSTSTLGVPFSLLKLSDIALVVPVLESRSEFKLQYGYHPVREGEADLRQPWKSYCRGLFANRSIITFDAFCVCNPDPSFLLLSLSHLPYVAIYGVDRFMFLVALI